MRIDNVHTQHARWSFGISNVPVQLHASASARVVCADLPNRCALCWAQRSFVVYLNDAVALRARLREHAPSAAAPLAFLFIWAFSRSGPAQGINIDLQPLPSPVPGVLAQDAMHGYARAMLVICRGGRVPVAPCAWQIT